jgi:hypothetical protein
MILIEVDSASWQLLRAEKTGRRGIKMAEWFNGVHRTRSKGQVFALQNKVAIVSFGQTLLRCGSLKLNG